MKNVRFIIQLLFCFFYVAPFADARAQESNEWLPVWDEEKITILANQGGASVSFELETSSGAAPSPHTLRPGETLAISNPQAVSAIFQHGKDLVKLRLVQDKIFSTDSNVWDCLNWSGISVGAAENAGSGSGVG